MYSKLSKHRNQFVCIDIARSDGNLRSSGFLAEVTPEYFTLYLYDEDGHRDSEYSAPLDRVVGMYVGHLDEQKIAVKVSLAASEDDGKEGVPC